jgi:SSS family solute:Na+ symporter
VAAIQAPGFTLAHFFPGWPEVITDLNVGIVALAVNVVVLFAVNALTGGTGRASRPAPNAVR